MTVKSTNLTPIDHKVTRAERWARAKHKGGVIWLTGLSGSGKSTLAFGLEQRLFKAGFHAYVLDGDNVRHGLCSDLGFSPEDRNENIRRIGEVAALFADAGLIVVTAFISPYRADRAIARKAGGENFQEVFVATDLKTCEARDPKGLYKKAREGKIPEFTGISAPYEKPEAAEFTVDTAGETVEQSLDRLQAFAMETFAL